MLAISCSQSAINEKDIDPKSFPEAQTLSATPMQIPDDDVYVVGSAAVTNDGYLFYIYDSDCFLLSVDSAFTSVTKVAFKGQGPNELQGVSGTFGQTLDDNGSVSILDPYAAKFYSYNPANDGRLDVELEIPTAMSKNTPFNVIKLKNGAYVSPRGDFKYGMISYTPNDSAAIEWPIGIKFADLKHPNQQYVSRRNISYSSENGIIAEIYGSYPAVVLHNEDGSVNATFTFNAFASEITANTHDGQLPRCFNHVCLTKNNIWLLYEDPSNYNRNIVLVLDYSGEPTAQFYIQPASNMSIDEKRKTIIAIDPNNDDANIQFYTIPNSLSNI
jgi:hypothetical protein